MSASGLSIDLHPCGVPYAYRLGSILINSFLPGAAEDAQQRLILRDRTNSTASAISGRVPGLTFGQVSELAVEWSGVMAGGLEHQAVLSIDPVRAAWIWTVSAKNCSDKPRTIDVLFGQDLALCEERNARRQEAYISQYIDQRAVDDEKLGWVLLCRQGQPQTAPVSGHQAKLPGCDNSSAQKRFPWLAVACVNGAQSYATDGQQFFGVDHRLTSKPAGMLMDSLPSTVLQYEMSYPALKTNTLEIAAGETKTVSFVIAVLESHPPASNDADVQIIHDLCATGLPSIKESKIITAVAPASLFTDHPLLHGADAGENDIVTWFPGTRRHEERETDGALLSFFTGDLHVVTQRKEATVARPHGWVLRSGRNLWVDPDAVGTTVYAAGVFNGQVYSGNPSFGRFLSPSRDALGVNRANGQRIFVQWQGVWRQLGLPSAFAMSAHGARWIYKLDKETIVDILCHGQATRPALLLSIKVLSGAPLAFKISHQIAIGDHEHTTAAELEMHPALGYCAVVPDCASGLIKRTPGAAMAVAVLQPLAIQSMGGDELLYGDSVNRTGPFAVIETTALTAVDIVIILTTQGSSALPQLIATERTQPGADTSADDTLLHAGLAGITFNHTNKGVGRIAEILPWFAHHAWVHFTNPHGLEQCDGGAWGTRDVSQGDLEWLLAVGQYAAAKQALRILLAHQYIEDGSFPQYFMVPPYEFMQDAHAHGDVAVWPLKAVSDYIEQSGDFDFLNEQIAWTGIKTLLPVDRFDTVAAHMDALITHLRARMVPDTALLDYGEGDWDDTMQPADPSLRSDMVSAWTVALCYQAVGMYAEVCRRHSNTKQADALTQWQSSIRADFTRLLMPDGVVAGFAVFKDGAVRPMLHPRDTTTNIRYRLLPMTRSMIGGLFTPEEARRHLAIINEHLLFPDGARLTSDTVPYRGGENRLFQRAETAANFGREIGLLYVHAHIRYAEAMAKIGGADALWRALQVMVPVELRALVPHSDRRQANTYFTSSDGDFPDRYVAGKRYHELHSGKIPVKAGWRFHSSGSGLYINKVITCLLGLRRSFDTVVFDPVLPRDLDGLKVSINWLGYDLEIEYLVKNGSGPARITINGAIAVCGRETNPYRTGGLKLLLADFQQMVGSGINKISIDV